jgi:hypothetical protein
MTGAVTTLLPELLELLFFGLSSVGLTVAGAYIERFAFLAVRSGDPKLGLWAGVIGAAAFYFAYLVATDKFVETLTRLRHDATEGADRAG